MSVHVISNIFKFSDATLATRLVLLALAEQAGDDGITWVSQQQLAERANVTDSTVRLSLDRLRDAGEIQVRKAQRGQRRINVYRIVVGPLKEPDYDRLPFELVEPFDTTADPRRWSDSDDRRSTEVTTADLRAPRARDPLMDPLDKPLEDPPVGPPAAPPALRPLLDKAPKKVDGKTVSQMEAIDAAEILAAWNEATDQSLSSGDWLRKIIMRGREHPELSLEAHVAIIRTALNDPWWKGPPSPSVVYGNGAIFEKCLTAAKAIVEEGRVADDYDPWASRRGTVEQP